MKKKKKRKKLTKEQERAVVHAAKAVAEGTCGRIEIYRRGNKIGIREMESRDKVTI